MNNIGTVFFCPIIFRPLSRCLSSDNLHCYLIILCRLLKCMVPPKHPLSITLLHILAPNCRAFLSFQRHHCVSVDGDGVCLLLFLL